MKACATCGRTLTQIRETGLLGCADCYRTFEESLQSLIERAQAGANFHIGRTPRGERDATARHELRSRLVKELDAAVSAEQYERAAKLRDRIHSLQDEIPSPQEGILSTQGGLAQESQVKDGTDCSA